MVTRGYNERVKFLGKALGWGLVIYAVMYLLWSGLVIYGLSFGVSSLVLRVVALAVLVTIAARSLHLTERMDVVPHSVTWAVVAVILDAIFLVPFSGWSLYAEWSVWAGYALVAIIPLFTYSSSSLKLSMRANRSDTAYRSQA